MAITAAQLDVRFNSSGADKVKGDLKGLNDATESANSGFNRLQQRVDSAGVSMMATGAMITRRVAAPMALVGGYMLNVAGDFEAGMNKVLAITDATGEQFDKLRGQAIDLSRTTRFTATEISEGMSFLAMAGFEVNEIYAAMPGMLDLAAASGINLGRSADIVSNIMQSMGIEAAETTRVVDVLVSAFTGSNVTVEMLGQAFEYVGTSARQAGWDIEQTTAVLGLLGNAGIQASMAGTSVRNWIVRLSNQTPKATAAIEALGVEVHNLDGSLKSPLELVREFEGAMDRMGITVDGLDINALTAQFEGMDEAIAATGMSVEDFDALDFASQLEVLNAAGFDTSEMLESAGNNVEFLSAMFDIFGIRGAPAFLALLQQGSENLETFTDRLYNAAGTAARVAQTMMKGLNGALLILKSAWEAWMIQLGDAGALDFATRAVQMLTRGIERLSSMSDVSRQRLLMVLGVVMALGPGLIALGGALRLVAFLMRTLGFSSLFGNLLRLSPLIAAAGLGFVAWQRNLLGVQSIIRRVMPALRQFGRVWGETFGRSRDQGDSMLAAALKATGNAIVSIAPLFGRLGDSVRDVGSWFREAGADVERVAYNFRQFRDAGVDPLSAALMSLGAVFPQLEGALRPIVVAFDQFRQGDYAGMFRTIADSLQSLAVNLVDWTIDVGVPTVTGWIVDAASNAWGAISAAAGWAWDGLVALGAWTLNTAVPAITGWIADNAGNVWDALSTAAGWVWDGIVELGSWVLNVAVPQVVGSATAIWDAIKGWVIGETGGVLSLPNIAVTVTDWIITGGGELIAKLDEFIFGEAGDREFTIPVINVTVSRVNVLPFGDKIQEGIDTAVRVWQTAQEVHADIEEIRVRAGRARIDDSGGGGGFLDYLKGEIQTEIDHASATWDFIVDFSIVAHAEVRDEDSTYNQVVDLIGDMAGGWGMLHGGTVDWDFVLGEPEILGFGLIDAALWIDEHIYQPIKDAVDGLKDKFTFDLPSISINWPDPPEVPGWLKQLFTDPAGWIKDQVGIGGGDEGTSGAGEVIGNFMSDLEFGAARATGTMLQAAAAVREAGDASEEASTQTSLLETAAQTASRGVYNFGVRFAEAMGLGLQPLMAMRSQVESLGRFLSVSLPPVKVQVTAETDMAMQGMSAVQNALAGLDGASATTYQLGDNAGALAAVTGAAGAVAGIDGMTALTHVNGDNANALGAVMGAAAAVGGIDGMTATTYINGVNNVGAAVAAAWNALNSIDGATATAYINVVSSGSGLGGRVPGFADGGFVRSPVALVGERGPELVQLPYGSYVHTADETARILAHRDDGIAPPRSSGSRDGGNTYRTETIELHIHGNVYGIDEMTDAMMAAVEQRRRGYGLGVSA